jgi:hypothetical protein
VPRFHDPVTDGGEADEQRMRQSREHGIRAFDEDAPVTSRRLPPGEIEPVRGSPPPHDKTRSAAIEGL